MNNSARTFVDRQNIVRYLEHLKTETNALRRRMLSKLLTEEIAKHGNGQKTTQKPAGLAS